jgi:hypothetical protein
VAGTPGGAGAAGWYATEPLPDPEVDQHWTSDRELDRLAPLSESLRDWAGVYDRWRRHELATARPRQAPFSRAEPAVVDELRGVHFGQLAAAGRCWRQGGIAATRLAESAQETRAVLQAAWRDETAQGAVRRLDRFQREVQDYAAHCRRLGGQLEIGIGHTVATVLQAAVAELLARSREWRPGLSRQTWERRIAELDRVPGPGCGGPAAAPEPYRTWCAELDALVTGYDALLGSFRATLAEASATVARVYQAVHREIGPGDGIPFAETPTAWAGIGFGTGTGGEAGPAPAATMLTAAGPSEDSAPSAGSSLGSGGAGAEMAPAAGGSAVLGDPGDSRIPPAGGAVLGSVPGGDPGYRGGAGYGGDPGYRGGAEYGSSAGIAAASGAFGVSGADDQQRSARPAAEPGQDDRDRAASWARLRALLGETADARPEPGGPGADEPRSGGSGRPR